MTRMHELISRSQAQREGRVHYFTGEECIHGHVSVRCVSSTACVECVHNQVAKTKAAEELPPLTLQERKGRRGTYSNLRPEQADAWYAQVDAICRQHKKFLFGSREVVARTKPLEERGVIFAPPLKFELV